MRPLGDKLMVEHDLDIETSDGLMNTFVTHPEEGGPFPVVLLLMDAIGKREELHADGPTPLHLYRCYGW